jgi:hypothetical protein
MRKSLAKWLIAQRADRGLPLSPALARRVANDPDLAAFEESLRRVDRRLRDELPGEDRSSPQAMRRVLAAVARAAPRARASAGRVLPARLAAAALIALAAVLAVQFTMRDQRDGVPVSEPQPDAPLANAPKIDPLELRRLVARTTEELAATPKPLFVEARLLVQDGKRFGAYLASGFSAPRETATSNIQ